MKFLGWWWWVYVMGGVIIWTGFLGWHGGAAFAASYTLCSFLRVLEIVETKGSKRP